MASEGESLPIFDIEDARLVGWELGQADDGDMVLQARCEHGCVHFIKIPPGGYITHDPAGHLNMKDGALGGPMKPPEAREAI